MRVLIANLKHLYQRRHLWSVYLFLGLMAAGSREEPGFVWFFVGLSGASMGWTSRELMSKPFARFLPGHASATRAVVFLIGLVVSTLTAALRHGGASLPETPIVFCAVVCLSMTVYLAFGGFVLTPRRARSPLVGILFGFAFGGVALLGWRFFPWVELMVARHPLWMILGGVLTSSAIWLRMGQNEWSRRLFSLGLHFNRAAATRGLYGAMERRYAREAGASNVVASFFIHRMRNAPDYSTGRYIWGTLYARWGSLAVWWKWLLVALIGVSVIALYTGWFGAIAVFLWISWVAVPNSWPPLHSVQLVPAGRRQRFAAMVSLAAVVAAIVALWIAVVSMLSVPLSILIPAAEVWGMPLACKRVPLGIASVPLIVVPFLATLFVLVPRKLYTMVSMGFVLILPLVHAAMVFMLWLEIRGVKPAAGLSSWVVGALLFGWMLFFAACKYRTSYGPLAGQ